METNILYSQAILAFIARLKGCVKAILTTEVGFSVRGDRFSVGRSTYPLKIVIIEHRKTLGYFDSNTYEIGVNKQMMQASPKVLNDLLRHELAHYLMWIRYGNMAPHHGKEFHALCLSYGWGPEVYEATIDLAQDDLPIGVDENGDKILSKIKKLLALATSQNQHESELATLKSNELLLKYNLSEREFYRGDASDDEEMLLKRIIKAKTISAKVSAIAQIVRTFFVETVFHPCREHTYLEVFGKKSNVAIAEYVALFLENEFERLWEDIKKQRSDLKGIASKNSFFRGIAKGYCQKIEALNQMADSEQKHGLVLIQNELKIASKMAYQRLSKTVSRYRQCEEAAQLGAAAGRKLHIKQGVEAHGASGTRTARLELIR